MEGNHNTHLTAKRKSLEDADWEQSEYEKQREENIARNQQFLEQLGLAASPIARLSSGTGSGRGRGRPRKDPSAPPQKKQKTEVPTPTRRMTRRSKDKVREALQTNTLTNDPQDEPLEKLEDKALEVWQWCLKHSHARIWRPSWHDGSKQVDGFMIL